MKLITIFVFVFVLFNCKDEDEVSVPWTCSVPDPAESLPWMKAKIRELEASSLRQYYAIQEVEYKEQTLFIITNCCPMCDSYQPIFNCAGKEVIINEYIALVPQKFVWRPDNYSCQFQ